MSHKEIRKKFLDFFEKNGHKIALSSSLIPKDDSSVLLTTAGMQQFKPYYLEEESPFGNRVASIQKCFRTSSIDEVGDERHNTFFEMLGNFSFKYPSGKASYFKEEAIKTSYEFMVHEMGLEIDYVSVFHGDEKDGIPRDSESVEIWKNAGVPEEKIKFFGKEDNFWGPTGDKGPCGPTTEIYVGGIEIWNIVFNEYFFNGEKYEKLKYQGIDTGMGLERLTMAVQKTPTIFETDLFAPIVAKIKSQISNLKIKTQNSKLEVTKIIRIIADHLRGAVFLISNGLTPSNVGTGYILRRILRRAATLSRGTNILEIIKIIIAEYGDFYPELKNNEKLISEEVKKELDSFQKSLSRGLKEFKNLKEFKAFANKDDVFGAEKSDDKISGIHAFNIYQTYGLPLELFFEELKNKGYKFSDSRKENIFKEFSEELKKHQEISRAGAENKFGGHGLKKSQIPNPNFQNQNLKSEIIIKLHTATHLLQAALRKILGNEVHQMGSDINHERLRFDFSFNRKLTEEEIKKVEDLVNEKIKEKLDVICEEKKYEDAIKSGALAFFKEKYPETVSVYSVRGFSKEICGGPHVKNTGELGIFKIIKEESSSAGVRRIKAILE